jgi:pimeloyl-ACP methyl ester carboxylesterase
MDTLFTEKTLEREGCALHYWVSEAPGRPWLMLLHGAATDHHMFDSQFPALAGSYGLIAMDERGAGLSRPMGERFTIGMLVDDAIAILDREGVGTVTLVGQSLGGNIAQEIVYRNPERVAAAVFIGCTCNTMKLNPLEKFAVRCSPAIFALYPEQTLIGQSARFSARKPEAQAYLKKTLGAVGKRDFSRIMCTAAGCLRHDEAYRTGKPMLLICGEADGTGNIHTCAPKWAAREPRCEFHMIPNAGHCANMDDPESVNALMLDFLRRHLGGKDESQ